MASRDEILRWVEAVKRRATDTLIDNLLVCFGGSTAGLALMQAAADSRICADELEAIKADLDGASFTLPESRITVRH
jgi:hypothetical protein